ncbi:MAG: DedA family protein [Armatimonadetes bacterium]|nr:DedA family protein [Armatimonadota bacterium]MDE2206786.1 DedA family protein [Armatimonadota bacterium]
MAIESACVPLPSELIMPFAGALTVAAIAGTHAPLNLNAVAFAGAFGCAIGSALAWAVGATGGREAALTYGKYLFVRPSDIASGERWFTRWGSSVVFVARLLPIVRTFISLPAGIVRMPFVRFIALSFLGSLPWCYLLAWLGILFARNLDALKPWFHRADALIIAAAIAGAALWYWRHSRRSGGDASL